MKPPSCTDVFLTEEGKEIRPQIGTDSGILDDFRVGDYAEVYAPPVEHFIAIRLTQFARIWHNDFSIGGTQFGDSHRPLRPTKHLSRNGSVSLLGVPNLIGPGDSRFDRHWGRLSAIASLGARWRHGRETRLLTAALEEERKRIAELERRVRNMP